MTDGRFRKWYRRLAVGGLTIGLAVAAIGLWVRRQTRHVPAFYAEMTRQNPMRIAEASRRMRAEVQDLQDDTAREGPWRAEFTGDVINAWLSEELPRKFPRLRALGASQPRVMIEEGRMLAAVRYRNKRLDVVVSCEVAVELTQEPNMLALRVFNLRAGALPLPLAKFLPVISREAARGDVDVRWDETDSGPIALVTIPPKHPGYTISPVVIESIGLSDGLLRLAGRAGPVAPATFRPNGPVHQFVSYRPGDRDPPRRSRNVRRL